jgi:TolB protein
MTAGQPLDTLVDMSRLSAVVLSVVTLGASAALADGAYASFPGRDGAIAVVRSYDLYLMAPGGRILKRLTHTRKIDEMQPAWSADGRRIAFARRSFADENHPGPVELWVMNADGSHQHRIAIGADPAWSPDGRWLAYTSLFRPSGTGSSAIWVIHTDGTHRHRLTFNQRHTYSSPDWSPDGRLIAYVDNFGGPPADGMPGPKTRAIYTMRPNGHGKKRLTPLRTLNDAPSWSPDGKRIAFARVAPPRNPPLPFFYESLWTMRANGSQGRELSSAPTISCAWAPAGDRIVLAGGTADPADIFTLKADGTGLTNLTHNHTNEVDPAWQPRPRG